MQVGFLLFLNKYPNLLFGKAVSPPESELTLRLGLPGLPISNFNDQPVVNSGPFTFCGTFLVFRNLLGAHTRSSDKHLNRGISES
ncbi:hypothetical protein TorRG33x02_275670 [Trema orientale]|uniref:Uncharacterized protein n=1 Tax=Trema orientale TaxID=63057 RepID=A0A2P5CRM3_TREOI|nr:hypothetical protein TorRG33x02_275670 [Trema orientale]